ncbi:MAG: hypothetical protein Ct9H300mP11_25070 [Chloroflexota bacterium]|nr:MAG: hypothetical protein Ct9H300mP11_25070 [Chloroflexota bacterium]
MIGRPGAMTIGHIPKCCHISANKRRIWTLEMIFTVPTVLCPSVGNKGGDLASYPVGFSYCLSSRTGSILTEDMNGVNPTGVGMVPMNNQSGVRMSTAITHLSPMRHRLNLTVRGNVFVRKVVIENGEVNGVEAESGGEIFRLESKKVVLSAGALKSPHILMLSGIGPKEQLEEFGVPVLQDTPGVGANLRNHPISPISYRVKEGITLVPDASGVRIALRYTAAGSHESNDMMMTTSSLFSPFTGEELPDRIGRISCVIELPAGSGFVRLASSAPYSSTKV